MSSRKLYTIKQGEPLELLFPLLLNGVAAAIAGWNIWVTVKRDALQPDSAAIAQLSLGSGIVGYDANTWLATIPAGATKTKTPGVLIYEAEARDPTGAPYALEEGDIILEHEINQAV